VAAVLLVAPCNGTKSAAAGDSSVPGDIAGAESAASAPIATPRPPYLETGDLEAIKGHGTLRILAQHQAELDELPRGGFPSDLEHETVEAFAAEQGLEAQFVYVDGYDELIPALLAGKGDVIAANMTVTDTRKKQISFSVPIGQSRQVVVQRASDKKRIRKRSELSGRTIAVRTSTAYYETAAALSKANKKIQIQTVPERMDIQSVLRAVADGNYDVTIADTNLVDAMLAYEDDLRMGPELTQDRTKAWGLRPNARVLKKALDKFLNEQHLSLSHEAAYKDDLSGLKRRKVLRMITRNSAASYFLFRGEVLGFEYELAKIFAEKNAMRLEVIVPPTREDLFPYLREGKGDLIAASLTASPERAAAEKVRFTNAYARASKLIVTRVGATAPKELKDLAGRTFWVRKSSSYWPLLEKIRDSGIALKIEPVPEDVETEEIIAKVASGDYDLTVADSPILDIELTWRADVTSAFSLGDEQPYGWAVRPEDTQLAGALDAFIKEEYRGARYNIAYRKYFKDPRVVSAHVEERSDRAGRISPYDELIRKYSSQYSFDWRLIAAQMYQESRFDPKARSWVGAVGLMQVMPRTAKQFGYGDVRAPDAGIHAGVEYMAWTRDRFDSELSITDRTWFALASYNAGKGHVEDARRLAVAKKLDPNQWFGHVEKAMLLLAKPEIARKSRFGYCRGEEPVNYVRQIRDRLNSYAKISGPDAARKGASDSPSPP
jgi:membrane-bound lytic murein transglycosylase F